MTPAVAPKFAAGALVRTIYRASGRYPGGGKPFLLDRGALLRVTAVLPPGEWGLPQWPRYELVTQEKDTAVPAGLTVRLDETALAPDGPQPAAVPQAPPAPPGRPRLSLFDSDAQEGE